MRILGVDPGSLRTGYGLIESDGRRHRLLQTGVIRARQQLALPDRLRIVHAAVAALLASERPDALAVEDIFYAANVRTALILGHVRGVVLLAGADRGIPVHAYPPATVKHAITGAGGATKEQVAFMVSRLLPMAAPTPVGDATDALAIALCHAHLAARPEAAIVARRA